MSHDNQKVSLKQHMATEDAIRYLEDLVQAYKDGKIVVEQGENVVSIEPGADVAVEVGAKQKDGKAKFSLELAWRTPQGGEGEEVRISSEEPEPAPQEEKKEEDEGEDEDDDDESAQTPSGW